MGRAYGPFPRGILNPENQDLERTLHVLCNKLGLQMLQAEDENKIQARYQKVRYQFRILAFHVRQCLATKLGDLSDSQTVVEPLSPVSGVPLEC